MMSMQRKNNYDQPLPHEKILKQYRDALLAHFPDDLQQLTLFGSQVTRDTHAESDIDVLVLMSWEEDKLPNGRYIALTSDPRWQKIIELAYDITLEYGIVLAPFVMGQKLFEKWSPLNDRIKQNGIEIWTRN